MLNNEGLEEVMSSLYLHYKTFREHLENILRGSSPDAGLESLKGVIGEARSVVTSFALRLPALEKNIKTI